MNDFIQGGYNKYEHDYSQWSPERLQDKITELAENQKFYVGERRRQVEIQMSIIAFEMSERLRESKNEQIEEAWGQHG